MSIFYCEPDLYTYAATPTWNTAQEGDGAAKGAATPATISFDIATWVFTSGSSTFSVMGCTALTVGGGANSATNAQYSATAATMAANIAAAINLATAVIANKPSGWVAHQVRNSVYARATGTVIELMTRAGSASWNTLVAMAFANVTNSASQSWASGASGAWGWLFNPWSGAGIWPSAMAEGTYGVLFTGTAGPLAGTPITSAHTVKVRANNVTLMMGRSGVNYPTLAITNSVNLLIDNGTEWSGDTGLLKIEGSASSQYHNIYTANFTTASIEAMELGRFEIQFKQTLTATWSSLSAGLGTPASLKIKNATIRDTAGRWRPSFTHNNQSMVFIGCAFIFERNDFYAFLPFQPARFGDQLIFDGCTWTYTALSAAPTYLVDLYGWHTSFGANGNELILRDVKVSGCPSLPAIYGASTALVATTGKVLAQNISGASIPTSLLGLTGKVAVATSLGYTEGFTVLAQNVGSDSGMRLESQNGVLDWLPGSSFPTYNALLPSGTYFSYRYIWTTSTDTFFPGREVEVLRLQKTASAASLQTVTLELLIDNADLGGGANAANVKDSHFCAVFTYTDASNIFRTERAFPSVTAIPSSAASWTLNGATTHVARKIARTLAYAIKINTQVEVTLLALAPAPNAIQNIYINPELGMA